MALLIQKGIGNPNPSALTVIRRTPNGGQIPIFVDLNRALVDPRERILVQAGDVLILQETRHESMARYFNDIFNFNIFWQAFQRGDASGAAARHAIAQASSDRIRFESFATSSRRRSDGHGYL